MQENRLKVSSSRKLIKMNIQAEGFVQNFFLRWISEGKELLI